MGIKLRTQWVLEPGHKRINHQSKVMLIGSCFSEHISRKLKVSGFDVLENPHGILFQPLAMERAISDCLLQTEYKKEDLVFNGEAWTSLNHHGRFNHSDPEVVLGAIHSNIRTGHSFLSRATHLVLTLGTSWAYRHREKNTVVANCHKIPQKEFEKILLGPGEIVESLEQMVSQVRQVNPSIVFVLTVSPVRHVKDGMVENTLSKARLHEAIHQLIPRYKGVSYFPAYEIMMDDLRDYRFYKSDLIHPNELAVDYIWDKFTDTWIDPKAQQLMKEAQLIHKALEHRPVRFESKGHQDFREKTEKQILKLEEKHPEVKIYRG